MNCTSLTYCQTSLSATICGTLMYFTFTGNAPRKGWRIPLNEIKYNEQRDEETGYGYFGARYMDHELMTMWLSVDPMADKYPGISPYAYCAWNPVKLVDPDGREIWIVGNDGNKYQYKRGKLYNKDGSRYKGNDKFANKVRKDLCKLERKGIKSEINEMASDERKHVTIKRTDGDNTATAENSILETNGVGCGTTIGYNPNLKSNNDGVRKEYIGLAHELGHAYNSFCGDVDNTDLPVERILNRVNHRDGTYSEEYQRGTIKMNEIYAVKFENRVRGKNEQRYTYDKFNIGKYL